MADLSTTVDDSLMGDSDFEPTRSPLKVLNVKDKPKDKVTEKTKDGNKRLSVERIYQKKSQLEHILLRPDTYIGSVEKETKQMWVFDEEKGMELREITYVPGLYKIFDEILVNAADNKQRDKSMSCVRIDIDSEKNEITIFNNGKGIPVVEHKEEKMFVPTLIFGHLLTSSNYDDNEKKVVGGRNGYGAKLCNVFSTRFKVETSCKEFGKAFSQVWTNNMKNATEPKITKSTGEDYTKVTFSPDLEKFKMDKLDKDIVDLFSRRAYDVAGSSIGIKVFLNGKRVPVNGFKNYIELFIKGKEDEDGNPLKFAHEVVNDRWEIGVTVSDKGFQQVSFVNSIATTRGGKHIDYITDQIVSKMVDIIKKKNKAGVNVKPFQIKNHLWVFVNCLIENPTFDSQTKETMTLQSKSFGSKCSPSEKFFTTALKTGIVESVMAWVRFKAQTELAKQCNAKKQSKLKGIPKLEDANDAGTKHSIDCTLILTEGDSAKSLVMAGLGVIGRDKYGVFPLRGKMLNVREASHKQILENAEINNLIKILGLQYKKQYSSTEDLKTLRYGKVMIMTDQDQDGSHIKGLLINFIHHNWPKLLELNFLEQFITPIVKVKKGNQCKSFYSLPEFKEWKAETPNWSTWTIKYYKGLGTSDSKEAREYFSDMRRHKISFKYSGSEDDESIKLAFSKKMVEQRKDWLTNSLEDRKRRREMGLQEQYLYESNTRSVSYKDFVNKELILFSNMDNERSIPSIMDGLKPGQRKVIFTCFLRNDKKEVKVAQLAGSVGEKSAYHHGEASLMSTIINLAHNFVGSNNINLLQPNGQFGTRLQGGKDSASPRYIFTKLSPLARKIFPSLDDPLLNSLYDDNLKIEPEYYVPILPMVLVNGAEGIGTGWSTKIPNYNPREIVENLRRMIKGEPIEKMKPWFKGFRGTITQIDTQRFVINGEIGLLDEKSFEITELPIRTWTQTYKESVLEPMIHGTEKTPAFINDYRDYHTDATVRFVVNLPENNLTKALADGIHKTFKLQTTMSTTSMVLFDHNGCIKRYETPEEILEEFFPVRLEFYVKRKAYYEGKLEAEALKLENMARFIVEKNDHIIKIENVKKKDFVEQLIKRGYKSDPVKAWIKKNALEDQEETQEENTEEVVDLEEETNDDKKYDYNYLFDMSMRSMLREKVEELLKQRDNKKKELEDLKKKTPQELWDEDLRQFLEELDKVEEQERKDALNSKPEGGAKQSKLTKGKGGVKLGRMSIDSAPSQFAERVDPKIEIENYCKKEKAPKKEKKPKAEKEDKEKNGNEENKEKPKTKKTEANKKKTEKKEKKKNPWSDSDESDDEEVIFNDESDEDDYIPVKKDKNEDKEMSDDKQVKRKLETEDVPKKSKKTNDSDEEFEVIEEKPKPKPKAKVTKTTKKTNDSENGGILKYLSKQIPKKNAEPKKKVISDSEDDDKPQKKKTKKSKDEDIEEVEQTKPVPKPKEKKVKKQILKSDSEESDFMEVEEKKPKQSKSKKSAFSSDSEDEIGMALSDRLESRAQPQRQRKQMKYVFSDDSD